MAPPQTIRACSVAFGVELTLLKIDFWHRPLRCSHIDHDQAVSWTVLKQPVSPFVSRRKNGLSEGEHGNRRKQPILASPAVTQPQHAIVFNPPPTITGPDRAEVIHRIRLVVGLMEQVVKTQLEAFQT
jgi:hypothetical protein